MCFVSQELLSNLHEKLPCVVSYNGLLLQLLVWLQSLRDQDLILGYRTLYHKRETCAAIFIARYKTR